MDNKYIDVVPDQPIAEGYNSDERELDVPDFPQGEQKVKTVKVEVEDIESGEKVAKKLGEYQGELSPNPGYGEDGETKDATKIHLVKEFIPADGGKFVDQNGIKVLVDPYNFIGGLLINGKTIEEYVDSKGGVTEEELRTALLEYTKKSEVAAQLVGKDIQVEGITSKGIANTGNIGNIGDIAATGKITGNEIIENMSGYSFELPEENPELTIIYASVVKNGNKITFVIFGKYNRPAENPKINPFLGKFTIPKSVADKIYPWRSFFVDSKNVPFFASASTITNKVVGAEKRSDTTIYFTAYETHTLTAETDYMFRIEETFLLSENLASE